MNDSNDTREELPEEEAVEKGYLRSRSEIFAQNTLLKFLMVALIVVQFWDSYRLSNVLNGFEQILIPSCNTEPYSIKKGSANEPYLLDMSQMIVNLWGTFTPEDVDMKFNLLLPLFHEESYPRYRDRLKEIATEVKKYTAISHLTQLRYPKPIKVLNDEIHININKYRVTGKVLGAPNQGTIIVRYVIENGRFKIIDMEEK